MAIRTLAKEALTQEALMDALEGDVASLVCEHLSEISNERRDDLMLRAVERAVSDHVYKLVLERLAKVDPLDEIEDHLIDALERRVLCASAKRRDGQPQ